jgi:hypothetical protein
MKFDSGYTGVEWHGDAALQVEKLKALDETLVHDSPRCASMTRLAHFASTLRVQPQPPTTLLPRSSCTTKLESSVSTTSHI